MKLCWLNAVITALTLRRRAVIDTRPRVPFERDLRSSYETLSQMAVVSAGRGTRVISCCKKWCVRENNVPRVCTRGASMNPPMSPTKTWFEGDFAFQNPHFSIVQFRRVPDALTVQLSNCFDRVELGYRQLDLD